jgi:hypothetical protein
MRLFRGMAAESSIVESIISTIKKQGLTPEQGRWQIEYHHPGALNTLFDKSDISLEDTRPDTRQSQLAVCACGDEMGAAYYAWRHNRSGDNNTPIMVEFDVDEQSIAVDGRDFLYSVFQFGDPSRARPVLEGSFGHAVLRYAERAWGSENQSTRIALCDLAIHDLEVVKAHHANTVVLGGRYRTVFKNAFLVKLPVEACAVVRVWSPSTFPDFPSAGVSVSELCATKSGSRA